MTQGLRGKLLALFLGANVVILGAWLGWVQPPSVLTQVPGVLVAGSLGALLAYFWYHEPSNDTASP